MKSMNPHTQEILSPQSTNKSNKIMPKYIIIHLFNTSDKDKILKNNQRKNTSCIQKNKYKDETRVSSEITNYNYR